MYSNCQRYISDRKPPIGALLNPYLSINQGLAGLWPFWSGAGPIIFDLSGNNKTGNIVGTAPAWVSGKFDHGLYLPGTNEYISISADLNLSGDMSICHLFAPASTTDDYYISDFWSGNVFACISGYQNGFYNVYGGQYPTGNAADSQIPMSGAGILDFFVWTKQGTTLKGYVNGKEESSCNIAGGSWLPELGLRIGRRWDAAAYANGRFELSLVYNRTLSASEIALLYLEPFCGFRWMSIEQLAAYYEEAPPEIQALFMDLSTQLWTIKHATGIFTKL